MNRLRDEDINKISNAYRNFKDIEKYAKVVPLDKIKENDYNLSVTRYVDILEDEEEIEEDLFSQADEFDEEVVVKKKRSKKKKVADDDEDEEEHVEEEDDAGIVIGHESKEEEEDSDSFGYLRAYQTF